MICCTRSTEDLAYKPLVDWTAKDLERWLKSQPSLRAGVIDCSKLLKGVTGEQLSIMTEDDLDSRGVPRTMRRFILDGIVNPTEEAQLNSLRGMRERSRSRLIQDEQKDAGTFQNNVGGTNVGEQVAAVVVGALAATTGFLAAESKKEAAGQATTADTLTTSVSLPYEWASESAEFGLEFVKKALEIGESLPMIGACFTLCLIIAKSAQQVYANNHNCESLARLATRITRILADADRDLLATHETSLAELQMALKDSVDCIQVYSKKGWLRKMAAPGGDTRSFQDLYARITHEMELLQFDIQMTPPQWRDESKALRSKVLETTGRTVEEGGLELMLRTPGAAEELHGLLGCDAQVLASELTSLAKKVDKISTNVDATLDIELQKEMRNAVQLSVRLRQPTKRTAHGHVYLQQAVIRDGMFDRKVAAFRVMTGHPVEMQLSVESRDTADLRVRAIERVEHSEASYTVGDGKRRCCSNTRSYADLFSLTEVNYAQLFADEDVDIPLENRKAADIMLSMPDDAGPKGEVLKLLVKLWISFEPNPHFGDGFERGKTVSVSQALYFCVYKKGSSRFMLRDMEDHTTKQRNGITAIAAPVLALPLIIHKRSMMTTEQMLKQQIVGWSE